MKVLVVGSGGREYALAKKISESEFRPEVHTAPGNAGTKRFGKNVPIKATDIKSLAKYAKEEGIDLTVVGPEDPLCMGIADLFHKEGLMVFGPTARGARMEGSKYFSKTVMDSAGVRSAIPWGVFCTPSEAKAYLKANWRPNQRYVVKADGLAAGKGVLVPHTLNEAYMAIDDIMVRREFGSAGDLVVIERQFGGKIAQEGSAIGITDGETVVSFASSQDHKPVGEFIDFHDNGTPFIGRGDSGKNTGGMGAYSPAPVLDVWGEPILNRVSNPMLVQLREEGITYRGVLYHGMWAENDGELPQVVENNVRFGDPEIQPILMRLNSDILPYLMACAEGKGLADLPPLEWDERPCVGVVLASGGYPGSYQKGKEITGIDDAEYIDGVHVFPAGVAEEDGKLFTSGGRVLLVAALGEAKGDYKGAIDRAYAACDMIDFEGMYMRDDIGHKALGGKV